MGNIVYGKEYDRNGFPVYGGRFKDGTWDGVGEVLGKEALKCKGYSRYGNYSNSKIVGYWNEIGKIKARKFNGFGVSYANNAKITIKYIDFNKREEKIEEHLSFQQSYKQTMTNLSKNTTNMNSLDNTYCINKPDTKSDGGELSGDVTFISDINEFDNEKNQESDNQSDSYEGETDDKECEAYAQKMFEDNTNYISKFLFKKNNTTKNLLLLRD